MMTRFSPAARAAVVLVSVFALGVLAGIAFERHQAAPARRAISAAEAHEALLAGFKKEVGLDDAQIEEVHRILAKHQDVVRQSWEELRPEVQSAMRQVHEEIAELLSPEQRERFHQWLMRRRQEGAR